MSNIMNVKKRKQRNVYNLYGFIYFCIKRKHPAWTHQQIRHCTSYAYRKADRRKHE